MAYELQVIAVLVVFFVVWVKLSYKPKSKPRDYRREYTGVDADDLPGYLEEL